MVQMEKEELKPKVEKKGEEKVVVKIVQEKDLKTSTREPIEVQSKKADVQLKIGHDEPTKEETERQEKVRLLEEEKRIEAVKKDLERFYEGKEVPDDVETPVEPPPTQEKRPKSKSTRVTPTKETEVKRSTKSERSTPCREDDAKPRGIRKKSGDDLVRAQHPIFKIPDTPHKKKKTAETLPSVDQFVTIADAKTLPYAFNHFEPKPKAGKRVNEDTDEAKQAFMPLDLMLRNSIEIPLRTQFQLVNEELLNFVFFDRDVSLWKTLEAIRHYLMLCDTEFAHNLCLGLVNNQARIEQSPSASSRLLHEAIHSSIRATSDPLSKHLGFTMSEDDLTLSLSVKWPTNIVITEDLLRGYQKIFQLMLKLEKTYLIIQQSFLFLRKRKANDPRQREIQLIRHGMLNFLLTMRGYLRNQILEKCWVQFKQEVERYVVCLDSLRTVHSFYVDKLLSKTFQKKEGLPIRDTIYRTLQAIERFSQVITQDDYEQAIQEAKRFSMGLNFFISIVSKLDVRGYKHHMQELLVCLKNAAVKLHL